MEQLLDYFKPTNYNLSLNINKSSGHVYGTAIISGEPQAEIVKFHAKNLKVTSITNEEGARLDFTAEGDEISLKPAKKYTIKYTFSLNTNMQGAYLSSYDLKNEEKNFMVGENN